MQTTTKHSRMMATNPINKMLVVILLIETILLAGVIGYRIGEANTYVQPVYQFTIQVDPSMIKYKEENIPKSEEETSVEDTNNEAGVIEPKIENPFTNEEIDYITKTVWGEARGLSKTQQAGVVWTILNRFDDGRFGKEIIDVITAPNQFAGYKSTNQWIQRSAI